MKKNQLDELIRVITYRILKEIQDNNLPSNPSGMGIKPNNNTLQNSNSDENSGDGTKDIPDKHEIKKKVSEINIELNAAKEKLESLKAEIKNLEKVTIPELKTRKSQLIKLLHEA